MRIKEIKAKSIISESGLPGSDFVINPYIGCVHGCIYCYAVFMKRFTNHVEPWGKFLDVKINAGDLVPKTMKYKHKSIFISSVCDPYQPAEKKYRLMRKILPKLIDLEPDLCILTKSDLVLRDIDLIKRFNNCEVGFSLFCLDEEIRRKIEPLAMTSEKRIIALKELKKQGIKTFIFISPLFPFLTDWKEIILKVQNFADEIWFENLNVRPSNWSNVKKFLKINYPELLNKYKKIYFTNSNYWNKVEEEIEDFCLKNKIKHSIYFHHKRKK